MGRWKPPPTSDPIELANRAQLAAESKAIELQTKVDLANRAREKAEQELLGAQLHYKALEANREYLQRLLHQERVYHDTYYSLYHSMFSDLVTHTECEYGILDHTEENKAERERIYDDLVKFWQEQEDYHRRSAQERNKSKPNGGVWT